MSQIIPQINAKRDKSSAGRHARPRRDGQWGVRGAPREGGCGAGSRGTSGQRARSPEPGRMMTAGRTRRSGQETRQRWRNTGPGSEAGKLKGQPAPGSSKVGNYRGGWGYGGHLQRRP